MQTDYSIHNHNGVNSLKIDSADIVTISSAAPTWNAADGTMVLVYDGVNYEIYFRINQTWKKATLT